MALTGQGGLRMGRGGEGGGGGGGGEEGGEYAGRGGDEEMRKA